jgi:hypothetical protein
MIMALELTIELLAENEKLQREIKKLLKKKKK